MFERFLLSPQRQRLFAEWQRFQQGRDVDRGVVRDTIFRSWERCRNLGVRPDLAKEKVLPGTVFAKIAARHKLLIECASNNMEAIFELINPSGSTMVLATPEGVVLKGFPESNSFTEGKVYAERFMGTSAVALCVRERQPIEIFGPEHYCLHKHSLACAASPIFDQDQHMIGILSIRSPITSYHPHTIGLIRAAVRAIEAQMRLHGLLDEQKMLLSKLGQGVVLLNKAFEIRTYNTKVLNILGTKESLLGKQIFKVLTFNRSVEEKIRNRIPFDNEEASLAGNDGASMPSCLLSLAVTEIGGSVLTFEEAAKVHALVSRVTGGRPHYTFADIVGSSPAMTGTIRLAKIAAESNVTTLLCGESGTGKELFAQAIHNASSRRDKPFIVVNCGALPRDLVQSELFGHEGGSFTGAGSRGKPGKVELANGGTLFLDEIGEMPFEAQVNLLRLIQNREATRVGGKYPYEANVRFIAATNRDLVQAVSEKLFREDLYYRLNVFTITIPPLRVRQDDVVLLAEYFIRKYSQRLHGKTVDLSGDVIRWLRQYSWPGNVRELENAMERAALIAERDKVCLNDLPPTLRDGKNMSRPAPGRAEGPSVGSTVADQICHALQTQHGHVGKAALALGMSRSTFYYNLHKYSIDVSSYREYPPGLADASVLNPSKG